MDPGNGFPGTGRAGSEVDPDRADPGKLIRVPGGYRVLYSSYFFPTFPILLHFYVTNFFQVLKKNFFLNSFLKNLFNFMRIYFISVWFSIHTSQIMKFSSKYGATSTIYLLKSLTFVNIINIC